MKTIKFSLIIFCLSTATLIYGQTASYTLLYELEQKAVFFKVDVFGNIYVSDGNVLFQYNEQMQLQQSYSDFSMGKIHSIDVSNPMKILLFSKDLMRISFLNNKLAVQNRPYLLSDLNIVQAAAVATSYDNGFWVYDIVKDVLIRFDASAKKVAQSQPLSTLISNKINPTALLELGGKYLVLCDAVNGFFIFDRFGTYLKNIPIVGAESFSVWNEKLVFVVDNKIQLLSIDNIDLQHFDVPNGEEVIDVAIKGKNIILLTKDQKLKVYQIDK